MSVGLLIIAVGSILAAVGTALPETLVPIIAIVFTGGKAAADIGVGAILGAPFMLASLAMVMTTAEAVIFTWRGRRELVVTVNEKIMRRDLSPFLIAYALAMGAGLIHVRPLHYALAAGLLAFYSYYVCETMRSEGDLGGRHEAPCTSTGTQRCRIDRLEAQREPGAARPSPCGQTSRQSKRRAGEASRPRPPAFPRERIYLAMTRSTLDPLATTVPASGTISSTVPGG